MKNRKEKHRKLMSLLLSLAMVIGMLPVTAFEVRADQTVYYPEPVYNTSGDPSSGISEWSTKGCTNYITIDSVNKPTELKASDSEWYVVKDTVDYTEGGTKTNGITVTGAVHLILLDGGSLTVTGAAGNAGICVSGDGNSLTIYAGNTAQTIAGTGALDATGGSNGAGIGGEFLGSGSNISINGGTVTATGGQGGAGIGGGYSGSGSNISINGGTVTATGGKDGAGIGSGISGSDAGSIFAADDVVIKADNSTPPTAVISHESPQDDIAEDLAGKRYVTAVGKTSPQVSDLTFTVPSNLVYNKEGKSAAFTGKDGMGAITVKYSTDREEWTDYPVKNANTYYVQADIADGTTYKSAKLTSDNWKFTISPAALTIGGATADGKTYDGTTAAVVHTENAAITEGLISGDDVSIASATGTFDTKDAGNGRTVTIQYTLGGKAAGNYTASNSATAADIDPKQLNVTAENKTSKVGEDIVALTYTADDLISGDSFTGKLATNADRTKAGTYDITQGNLTAGDNYSISFTKGTYTVTAPDEYTITFDANGGSGSMAAETTSNKKLTLPGCGFTAPEGREFEGWGVGSADAETKAAGTEEIFAANTTVYAKWKAKTAEEYTITFNANGGSGTMPSMTTDDQKLTLPENDFTAPEGKQFAGWGIGSRTGDAVAPGEEQTFDEDTTVYALWEDEEVIYNRVTFRLGGKGKDFTVSVASGSCAKKPAAPTYSGWTFVRWCKDSLKKLKFDFSTPITEDTEIYAKWSRNESSDDDNSSSTAMPSKPAKTGTWDDPVTDGTWSEGSNGKWMYQTNAGFRNTWGYIQYVDRNGIVQTGWFWFDANGYMVTGWVKIGGSWFYFDETEGETLGLMKQGWITWNGNRYYLTEGRDGNGGKMLANTTTPDGHVVDETGKRIR